MDLVHFSNKATPTTVSAWIESVNFSGGYHDHTKEQI